MHPVLLSNSPILDLDATLFVYLGVFFALFLILRALVFRPMMDLFEAREKAIDGAKRDAKDLEKRAEEKLVAFEAEMAKVRKEVGVERDRMKAEALRTERQLIDKVQGETEKLVRNAEAQMNREAATLREQIDASSPGLARQIAKKLLGREVSS